MLGNTRKDVAQCPDLDRNEAWPQRGVGKEWRLVGERSHPCDLDGRRVFRGGSVAFGMSR